MIELFEILQGMTPNYLSELFVTLDTAYDTRDKCKSIQPPKGTTTHELRFFPVLRCICLEQAPQSIKEHSYCINLIFHQIRAWADMFMSYMHCFTMKSVYLVYYCGRGPDGVTALSPALSSLVASQTDFKTARGRTCGRGVGTVTT